MTTITEAAAHLGQLVDLGCDYEEAVANTQVAFELDELTMGIVENVYGENVAARFDSMIEPLMA